MKKQLAFLSLAFLLSALLAPYLKVGFLRGILYGSPPVQNQAFSVMSEAEKSCSQAESRTDYIVCFIQKINPVVKEYGVSPFMQVLETSFLERQSTIYGGMSRCHDIAHAIGQSGVKHYDAETTVMQCSSICGAGCFHGAMEGSLAKGTSLDESLRSFCKQTGNPEFDRTRWACFHGLGHGVASLIGEPVESLKKCDLIGVGDGISNCTYGVFMELYQSSSFGHSKLPAPENMLAFCSSLWGEHERVCYLNAGLQEYLKTESPEEAAKVCKSAPSEHQEGCLSHLGNLGYHILEGDAAGIIAFCKKLGLGNEPCLKGALQESVTTDPMARDGIEICSLGSSGFKKECYNDLIGKVKSSHGDQAVQDLCTRLPEEDRGNCSSRI